MFLSLLLFWNFIISISLFASPEVICCQPNFLSVLVLEIHKYHRYMYTLHGLIPHMSNSTANNTQMGKVMPFFNF